MRPVDKGNSPYGDIKDYSEAGYYLERARRRISSSYLPIRAPCRSCCCTLTIFC